jgi:hypothetical protein
MAPSPHNNNPYNAEMPIENMDKFFGRTQELDEIVDNRIRYAHPISTILIGGRKIGKTSLLYQIRNQLLQQPICGNDIAVPIYVTFHGGSSLDMASVFAEIILKITRNLHDIWGLAISFDDSTDDSYKAFCHKLHVIWDKCSEQIGSVRFVILIDEAERLLGHDWTPDVISNLRDLINTSDLKSFVVLVVTGFRELHDYAMTEEEGVGSALGNAARWTSLGVLTEAECRELINLPQNDSIEEMVISAIYEQSGGHPFITQYILQKIWKPNLTEITIDSVTNPLRQFNRDTRVFYSWLEKFDDLDQKVFYALAQEDKSMHINEIYKVIKDDTGLGNIEDSLDFLIYTGVIAEKGGKYLQLGNLFRDWFLMRAPNQEKQVKENTDAKSLQQNQQGLNIKRLLLSVIVVLLIFVVTITVLVWAAQQTQSSVTFAIILVVAVVFDLVSIVTMLLMNEILPKRWTMKFYDSVLSKVPILDFSKYFQSLTSLEEDQNSQETET